MRIETTWTAWGNRGHRLDDRRRDLGERPASELFLDCARSCRTGCSWGEYGNGVIALEDKWVRSPAEAR
jgi:hypothetical protein